MSATASEVFGVSQYANKTLLALYDALKRNPNSKCFDAWEFTRLAAVREEMQRRGLKI